MTNTHSPTNTGPATGDPVIDAAILRTRQAEAFANVPAPLGSERWVEEQARLVVIHPMRMGARGWVKGHAHLAEHAKPQVGDVVSVQSQHHHPSSRTWTVIPSPWAARRKNGPNPYGLSTYQDTIRLQGTIDGRSDDYLDVDLWIDVA